MYLVLTFYCICFPCTWQKFVTWPRGLKLACACYLASVSISEPETKTPWVARAPKNKDPLKWYVMACSRLSQVGKWMNTVPDIFQQLC